MQEENFKETNEIVAKSKNTGNTVLTIINVIMFIGLIVLYFIVLKPENKGNVSEAGLQKKLETGNISIAYVNSDSILAHYDLVKSMRSSLEMQTASLEGELKKKQAAFDKDAAYFQEQVNKQTISESSAQEIYAQLMAEQQKLYELRERYSNQIAEQEYNLNLVLIDSLNNFLGRYNKKVNFDYIFSYSKGGNILVANDSLDITSTVMEQINSEYSAPALRK